LKLVAPEDLENLRIQLDGYGYLYAKLSLGPSKKLIEKVPDLSAIKFKLLEANAGVKQQVDLASSTRQAFDPDYKSRLATSFKAEVKADAELTVGFNWLQKKLGLVAQVIEAPLLTFEEVLAETPRGTLKIEPASVMPGNDEFLGEMATFIFELDPVTYLGLDAVEKVEVRWKKEAEGGQFTLENGRPSCHEIAAAPGQKKFECQTDFLEEHEGEQTFYAFAHVKIFGVPVPVPLEIAEAKLMVGGWHYFEDFNEGPAGPEWSMKDIAVSPSGERFLGTFSKDFVTLSLGSLPEHEEIEISFDFYVIDDWNGGTQESGADLVEFIANGKLLLRTTFSNDLELPQSYPDPFPTNNQAGTGATGYGTLDYPAPDAKYTWTDTTYRIVFKIPHTQGSFWFRVAGMPTSSSEVWGIDNVRVVLR
jgi:hypothetical protein